MVKNINGDLMKKIIILISLLLISNVIYADDLTPYLTSLQVMNGINTIPFNQMNTLYTINVLGDVESLDLSYSLLYPETSVEVIGNSDFHDGVNDVFIKLNNNDLEMTYHLLVNRYSDSEMVFNPVKNDEFKEIKYLKYYCIVLWLGFNSVVIKVLFRHKKIKHQ